MKLEEKSNQELKSTEKTSESTEFNLWQLWNMNVGFLGIQFAWGLQMANMSAIFEHLGALPHQLPILWIAAPLTGLIIQPIIGNISDYTWTPLGRRKPYFLVGAIFGAISLIFMPHASGLWVAALLLWILDTSANVSMVPFRAFVGDLLPPSQRTKGFTVQSFMVGMGAVLASALPWLLSHWGNVNGISSTTQPIPSTVTYSFYIGASVFLATVIWTIITTAEKPPQDEKKLATLKASRGGILASFRETWKALQEMPPRMVRLARVQFFTWLGIFCFFLYFPPTVARNIFGALSENSPLYNQAIEWSGVCFALFNATCLMVSFFMPYIGKKIGRPLTHGLCLSCGGLSLISMWFIHNQYLLLLIMIGLGIAWASTLIMPYAMLTTFIPADQRGIYQGIFNFFIVLPEIAVSLGFGWVMNYLFHDNRLWALVLGGVFMVVGAFFTIFLKKVED